jgi:ribonuclease Z
MRMKLIPQLTAPPCGDAGLFLDILGEGRGLLFDLGHQPRLPTRLLRRASSVFISHTHLDHFVDITHFLRASITRTDPINLYGPPGFLKNVQGLFSAFTWNVSEDYPLVVRAHEFDGKTMNSGTFSARNRFRLAQRNRRPAGPCLIEDDTLTVRAAILDHGTPVAAYRVDEKRHINVNKDAMDRLGYVPGEWIVGLKQAIQQDRPPSTSIRTPLGAKTLKALKQELIILTEGQSIGYLVDFFNSRENQNKVMHLFKGVHLLYVEASFEAAEKDRARERNHLTSAQAGALARRLRAKKVIPIHLSPKYLGRESLIFSEVQEAFLGKAARKA